MIDVSRQWVQTQLARRTLQIIVMALLFSFLFSTKQRVLWAAMPTQAEPVSVTVLTTAVNLRSGPDKLYPSVGQAQRGENLVVLNQYNNCAWLQVRTAQNIEGWVTGKRQFIRLNGQCEALGGVTTTPAASEAPATSEPLSPSQPTDLSATATPLPTIAPTPAPPPTALATAPIPNDELAQKVPLEAGKGCYLFQNFLGREILITLTNQETNYVAEFRLAGYGEEARCLPPGLYSFTLSAAGYQSLNNAFRVYAGVRDYFQINGRN